ncbi:MAG TPA: hypothetical protein ENN81_01905 [Phycisphaerales bacterium]|nr:hypothetical protein [Phycisphaerales bacterium]
MLPKDYIAVGFGAAGEPEWDVTVLHIWARPLRGGSTLGPVEQSGQGVEPVRLTNTNQWKQAAFVMPRCLFASSRNLLADMYFVTGRGACLWNIRLEKP